MVDENPFQKMVELAMAAPGSTNIRPVIEKELLHYDILFCLDKERLLDPLTFQGGTSLRLCHGSPRYSEDLDFAGGKHFASRQLQNMKSCLEDYIGRRYGLEVIVKEPAELRDELEDRGINVDKWQVAITTAPQRRDFPRQRIKIEVANVPAYSREPRALRVNYDFLPDGYGDTLIMTETLDEVMADKLIFLVNTQRYVRHRDLWDLRWLRQQGAEINATWIGNKITDYGIEDYPKKIQNLRQRLPEIIHGTPFREELLRFLPEDVRARTLDQDKFYDFLLTEITEMLYQLEGALSRD